MTASAKSLRCLIHPLSLASLILLLLNDHLLKWLTPSWLTGKLSDFSGLFFFPFLLAALLAFILREKLNTRQVGILAFGITAVWFVLMKTTAWGNAFTENFASFVLQTRAQIIQDPTDVIALGVMVPGWTLWEKTKTTRPPKWAWLALLVAAFAAMATSPLPPPPSVGLVTSEENLIRARGNAVSAQSQDGGKTWATDDFKLPHNPKTFEPLCQPNQPLLCYKLDKEQIQESQDGGKRWQIAWQIPPWRRDYLMRRKNNCALPIECYNKFDPGPFGMAFAEPANVNGLQTLVVALGTEGVLVRTPEGTWHQYPVQGAMPTPERATDLSDAVTALPFEQFLPMLGAPLLWVIASLWSWHLITLAMEKKSRAHPSWRRAAIPFLASIVILGTVLQQLFQGPRRWEMPLWMLALFSSPAFGAFLLLLVPLGILAGYGILWFGTRANFVWVVAGWCVLMSVAAGIVWLVPFLLWAFGIVPFYFLALGFALVLFFVWLWWSWKLLKQLSDTCAN